MEEKRATAEKRTEPGVESKLPWGLQVAVLAVIVVVLAWGGWWIESRTPSVTGSTSMAEPSPTPTTLVQPVIEPKMVQIAGGCFQMGSPTKEAGRDDDERQHQVCVKNFEIGQYEVTFEEYDRFCAATKREKPGDEGWGRGQRPVINVNWNDAVAYAQWFSQQTGKEYRLPTEAEWEYAARAGTTTAYWWGKDIGRNRANCDGCGSQWDNQKTAPVGSFDPNPWKLYDTAGNVEEWTCSVFDKDYGGAEQKCSKKDITGYLAVRGDSWNIFPAVLRSADRYVNLPNFSFNWLGFRLARSI